MHFTLNLMFHWLIFDNVVISLAIFALLYGLSLCKLIVKKLLKLTDENTVLFKT